MTDVARNETLAQLKAMQGEITAIRFYNKKLSDIKKNIDSTTVDNDQFDTSKAERLKQERADYFATHREPQKRFPLADVFIFGAFAVFSLILMIMLYPAERMGLVGSIIDWICLAYFFIYPVVMVLSNSVRGVYKLFKAMPLFLKIILLVLFAISFMAVIPPAIFAPIFLLSLLPLAFGAVAMFLKNREDKKIAALTHEADIKRAKAKYAKLIREAEMSDVAEEDRAKDALVTARKEKEAKYAEIIKECTTGLAKHKAKFKEVNILPAEVLVKDMGIVAGIIPIIQSGDANSIDEAIELYYTRLAEDCEINVCVYLWRKTGWSTVRNLIFLDGERNCSAQLPYSTIKTFAGSHTLKSKVQLNIGGKAIYPESENVSVNLSAGEKVFVKFYIKDTPDIKAMLCENADQFSDEI